MVQDAAAELGAVSSPSMGPDILERFYHLYRVVLVAVEDFVPFSPFQCPPVELQRRDEIGYEVVVSDTCRQVTIVRRLLALPERSEHQEVSRSSLVMFGFAIGAF